MMARFIALITFHRIVLISIYSISSRRINLQYAHYVWFLFPFSLFSLWTDAQEIRMWNEKMWLDVCGFILSVSTFRICHNDLIKIVAILFYFFHFVDFSLVHKCHHHNNNNHNGFSALLFHLVFYVYHSHPLSVIRWMKMNAMFEVTFDGDSDVFDFFLHLSAPYRIALHLSKNTIAIQMLRSSRNRFILIFLFFCLKRPTTLSGYASDLIIHLYLFGWNLTYDTTKQINAERK